MADQASDDPDRLDRATSAAIRRAIGERLRGSIVPDTPDVPPRLKSLLAAMRQQEDRQQLRSGLA